MFSCWCSGPIFPSPCWASAGYAAGRCSGWWRFFTLLGIVFTVADLERFQLPAVLCQLLSGWSILIGVSDLLQTVGMQGLVWMIAGGLMYTVGAVLYGIGKYKKYCHSVFHVFCLLGSFCHFWAIYQFLL